MPMFLMETDAFFSVQSLLNVELTTGSERKPVVK